MKLSAATVACLLAVFLAAGLFFRIQGQHGYFERSVKESLKTTEGYDQRFIDLVNRLEDILATRAQFAYRGGKDPMTGRVRQVVKQVAPVKRRRISKKQKSEPVDPVKLTAIIADEKGHYTAIVMDGDRSLSVEVGEQVRDRVIISISKDAVVMEDLTHVYRYDISGKRFKKHRYLP